MKRSLLFPRYFKVAGFLMVIWGLIMGLRFQYKNDHFPYYDDSQIKNSFLFPNYGTNTFNDEIIITLLVMGFTFIGFSKLKAENETTTQLRLRALYWSFSFYFGLLSIFFTVFYIGILLKIPLIINHEPIFDIITYNLFVPLAIFSIRFYYLLAIHKNERLLKPATLLPFKPFKLTGKVIISLFIILIPLMFASKVVEDFLLSGALCLLPPALFIWMISKEKNESDVTDSIRLRAMQIACYINYTLSIILTWFVYDLAFLAVLYISLISLQFIYLCTFYLILARQKRITPPLNITVDPAT